jgi:hypothetical protein
VAPPTAAAARPATAPRSDDDSGANGAATPSPDAEKEAKEAAKKARRRENDRLRRLRNKAKAEREKNVEESPPVAATTVFPYEARRRGERKRSRASSATEEEANDEAPERASKEEEERLAVLEMEEAQRVIARLVGGAETERPSDEKTVPAPAPAPERHRTLRTKNVRAAFARAPRMDASASTGGPTLNRTEVGTVPKKTSKVPKKPYAPPPRFDKKFAPDFSKIEAYPLPLQPRGVVSESPSPGKEAEDERRVSGSPGSPGSPAGSPAESPAGSPAGSPGRKVRLLRDVYGEDWAILPSKGTRNARGKRLRKSVSRVSVDLTSERASRIENARTRSDAPPRRASRRRETAEPSPSEPSPSEPSLSAFKKKPRVVDDDDEGALDAAAAAKPLSTRRSSGKKRPSRGKEPKPPPKEATEREPEARVFLEGACSKGARPDVAVHDGPGAERVSLFRVSRRDGL